MQRLVGGDRVDPTFYTDFPVETSPLTRTHRTTRGWRSGGTWWRSGWSWAPLYSELIDPVEQRERLTAQSLKAAAGDLEAMQLDEAFLTALEYAAHTAR